MLMSSAKLIILRVFNITLGKIPFCSKLLKSVLVALVIKRTNKKYFASSKFFDWKELDE